MPIYKMANLYVDMTPHHALTSQRAAAYRSDASIADIVLPPCDGDAYEEHAVLGRGFYGALLEHDGFLLHASAVELDGKAYLFSASSGTGKSTHAAFWQSELGALTINDDKPAVRLIDGVFHACGTPFSGKEDKSRNVCVPLGAIVVLRRGEKTKVEPIATREALFRLLDQTIRPAETAAYERLLTLAERVIESVPMYIAYVPNDPSSAREVYQQV
ncbi:MAG: hypothetical protein IJB27_05775 [Clostridia bacterium]|nr:hypothetical protein [Clostridia bacterium]